MTNPVESQNPLSNEALISDKRKELDWINKKLRTPELPKEEEKKLKKAKKKLEKEINELLRNEVDQNSVKELLAVLSTEGSEREITVNTLMKNFELVSDDINKILWSIDKPKMALILNRAYDKADSEEKREIALLYKNLGLEEHLQTEWDQFTEKELEIMRDIRTNLSVLQSEIVEVHWYDLRDNNEVEADESLNFSNISKRKLWKKTINEIYKQLASKDDELVIKLSWDEKRMMKRFVWLVSDIENGQDNWIIVYDDKDNRPVEVRLLEYMKNNPKEALHNTDREWLSALKNMGILVQYNERVNGSLVNSMLKKLKDFAWLNAIVTDVVTQWTLGESYSNFSNYIDMVLYNGGFENMVRSWASRVETSKAEFWTSREARLAKYKAEMDETKLIDIMLDFNLDWTLSHWDSWLKSASQIKEVISSLGMENKVIFENILAALNKSLWLTWDAMITKANMFDINNFDKIQDFLANPPMDIKYILQFGADAWQKALEAAWRTKDIERVKQSQEYKESLQKHKDSIQQWISDLISLITEYKKNPDDASIKAKIEANSLTKWKTQEELDGILSSLEEARNYISTDEGAQQLNTWIANLLDAQLANYDASWTGLGAAVGLDLWNNFSFNVWASMAPNAKSWDIGFNFAWNPTVNLGKGWKWYASISAGTTLGVIPIASAGIWVWKKIWASTILTVGWSVNFRWTVGVEAHVGLDWDENKTRLERQRETYSKTETILTSILSGIQWEKITLDADKVKNVIKDFFKDAKDQDIREASESLLQYLRLYEGVDNTLENRGKIVEELSNAYSQVWSNEKVADLDRKWYYVSWVWLSVAFYSHSIPIVWVLKFANHRFWWTVDSRLFESNRRRALYSDVLNDYIPEWITKTTVDELNKKIWIENGLFVDWDYLMISNELFKKINVMVHPNMKWQISKTDSWIVINKNVPIRLFSAKWVSGETTVLSIWSVVTSRSDIKAQNIPADWFVDRYALKEPETLQLSASSLAKMIADLKEQAWENWPSNNPEIVLNSEGKLCQKVGDNLTLIWDWVIAGHNLKISRDGVLSLTDRTEWNFKIELEGALPRQNLDFSILSEADWAVSEIVSQIYTNSDLWKDNKIANIAHKQSTPKLNSLYSDWIENNSLSDLDASITSMSKLLQEMASYIWGKGGEILNGAKEKLQDSEVMPEVKLRLLLALNGLFSRSHNIKWTNQDNKYDLMFWWVSSNDSFDRITDRVSKGIISKMDKDIAPEYQTLFNKMNESSLDTHTVSLRQTTNTIGYNYGNPYDLMKPVVNPYVIDNVESVSSDEIPEAVKKHVLSELLTTDTHLFGNDVEKIMKTVWVTTKEDLVSKINEASFDWDKMILMWTNWKQVELSGAFKTWFYAQCVNHMVMIENLTCTIVDWNPSLYTEALQNGRSLAIVDLEAQGADRVQTSRFQLAASATVDVWDEGGKKGWRWDWNMESWTTGGPEWDYPQWPGNNSWTTGGENQDVVVNAWDDEGM